MAERDPQSVLYDRFVRDGEEPDEFSAKRLYPGLGTEEAVARIRRLAAAHKERVELLGNRGG